MSGKQDIQAGSAYVKLTLKNDILGGLVQSRAMLKNFGQSAVKAGAVLAAAGGAILAPLTAAAMQFANSGKELAYMSARTGVSARALSELGFAGRRSGVDLEALEVGFKKMHKTLGDAAFGSQEAAASLAQIGLNINMLRGLSPDKQFEVIADRIAGIRNPSMQAAAAMHVFGKNGTQLLPLLAKGSKGIQELRQEAEKLGVSRSDASVAMAQKLAGLYGRAKDIIEGTVNVIGQAMAPALIKVAQIHNMLLLTVQKLVKQFSGVVPIIAAVGSGLVIAGTIIGGIGAAVLLFTTAWAGIGSIIAGVAGFLATPLGITLAIAAGVVGIAAAWMRFTELGRQTAGVLLTMVMPMVNTILATVRGISDAIAGGDIVLAGQIAMKGLQLVFTQGVNLIADSIGSTLGGAVADIATTAIAGDLRGAWSDTIAGMSKLWADFSMGVVSVFTAAAKAVADRWQQVVNSIAKGMLKGAAGGGVMGKILSKIIGVDVKAAVEENDRIDRQRGIKQDALGIGFSSINDSTNSIADPVRKFLDSTKTVAADNADEKGRQFKPRSRADTSDQLETELAALQKKAAAAKKQLEAENANKTPQALGDFSMGKMAATGGFSAEGLAAQLTGGGTQERIARGIDVIKQEAKRQTLHLENLNKKKGGFSVAA